MHASLFIEFITLFYTITLLRFIHKLYGMSGDSDIFIYVDFGFIIKVLKGKSLSYFVPNLTPKSTTVPTGYKNVYFNKQFAFKSYNQILATTSHISLE